MQSILYPGGIPLWRNVVFIQWVVQIVSAIIVIAIVSGFIFNVANEIREREIPSDSASSTKQRRSPSASQSSNTTRPRPTFTASASPL